MPKPSKRLPKSTAPTTAPPTVPAPFAPAPQSLQPLLSTLSKSSVYITHIDRHPAPFKRRVFAIPVLLNLTLVLALLWRAYIELPFYWLIALSALGHPNATTIRTADTAARAVVAAVVRRAAHFLLDWLLVRVVAPWPFSFFLEAPGNPALWRWRVGFRDAEVYVRVSRRWGREELLGAESGKRGGESPFFKVRVLPALERERVRAKTGYLLMDGDWDLDFAAMVEATRLLDEGVLREEQLEKSVLVWCGNDEEQGQWVAWECWKLDEGAEAEQRKKIIVFKDRLTQMGKESLFFRWIEIVQYESSQPGGFTPERQIQAAEKAKQLFAEQGVDFDDFIKSTGGLEGMPGMENAR
ncbi:hypothetical protein AOQ84DRAFT_440983 [Glonium stellatum]|uniref:Uncharacterized protein n=1 Tax=Glonium stellatum TaxID=574774 RepID=A0A8E2JQT6_9PEZI|nr:hypothetical protein AOQ84DRAFT_440983 [Glonium stellatum]